MAKNSLQFRCGKWFVIAQYHRFALTAHTYQKKNLKPAVGTWGFPEHPDGYTLDWLGVSIGYFIERRQARQT
jgi:hypothetical protein